MAAQHSHRCATCGAVEMFASQNQAAAAGWSMATLITKDRVKHFNFCSQKGCVPAWFAKAMEAGRSG